MTLIKSILTILLALNLADIMPTMEEFGAYP
jgi:hypothetical protein